MSAVVKVERPEPLAYVEMERLAASIAKSGLFGIKTTDQAIALMMIAHAEGRHPVEAARDYDVIQGRPAKKAEAMLRDFLSAGGTIKWHDLSDSIADATFSHPVGGSVRIAWDLARAEKAGLAGKDMYKKFPRQMLRSRTVSEGVRTVWPMATSGMYVPEEASDIPFAGQTIEVEAPTPPPVTATTSLREKFNAEVPMKPVEPTQNGNGHKRTIGEFMAGLRLAVKDALRDSNPAEAVDRVICGEEVMRMKEFARGQAAVELNAIITDALLAVTPQEPPDASGEELPEIVGQERMGAG